MQCTTVVVAVLHRLDLAIDKDSSSSSSLQPHAVASVFIAVLVGQACLSSVTTSTSRSVSCSRRPVKRSPHVATPKQACTQLGAVPGFDLAIPQSAKTEFFMTACTYVSTVNNA